MASSSASSSSKILTNERGESFSAPVVDVLLDNAKGHFRELLESDKDKIWTFLMERPEPGKQAEISQRQLSVGATNLYNSPRGPRILLSDYKEDETSYIDDNKVSHEAFHTELNPHRYGRFQNQLLQDDRTYLEGRLQKIENSNERLKKALRKRGVEDLSKFDEEYEGSDSDDEATTPAPKRRKTTASVSA